MKRRRVFFSDILKVGCTVVVGGAATFLSFAGTAYALDPLIKIHYLQSETVGNIAIHAACVGFFTAFGLASGCFKVPESPLAVNTRTISKIVAFYTGALSSGAISSILGARIIYLNMGIVAGDYVEKLL